MDAAVLGRWDALVQGDRPEDLGDWDLVQTVFQVAAAKGLLELAEDGAGFTIEESLTQIASGDLSDWGAAVEAVLNAELDDPEPRPTASAEEWDREGGHSIWRIALEMERMRASGKQDRIVVARDHGATGGLAWVPTGDDKAIAELQLGTRASEWQRRDGARLAWIPNPALALAALFEAERQGRLRIEAGQGGPVVVATDSESQVIVDVLVSHQKGAQSPDDDGLHALIEGLSAAE